MSKKRLEEFKARTPELQPPFFYFYLGKVDDRESLSFGSPEHPLLTQPIYLGEEDEALLIYYEFAICTFWQPPFKITEHADGGE